MTKNKRYPRKRLSISQNSSYNPENLAEYSQIMSNCCVKISTKSDHSNRQNHVFPRKLTFGRVANVISQVECSWWARITSLTKIAIKQSGLNVITWNFRPMSIFCLLEPLLSLFTKLFPPFFTASFFCVLYAGSKLSQWTVY